MNMEDKLDKIIELLEKLAEKEVTISSPISVKSEEGKSVDINKHLYNLANKIERRKVEKPTIRLLDDKGKAINFECQVKDDGSITCVNKDAVIVDWSLIKDIATINTPNFPDTTTAEEFTKRLAVNSKPTSLSFVRENNATGRNFSSRDESGSVVVRGYWSDDGVVYITYYDSKHFS